MNKKFYQYLGVFTMLTMASVFAVVTTEVNDTKNVASVGQGSRTLTSIFYSQDALIQKMKEQFPGRVVKVLKISNREIVSAIAETEKDIETGLSGQKELLDGTGLLFIFDYSDKFGFWMKEMNFPIDILWLDESLKVVDITENMSPRSYPKIFRPSVSVRNVLEVPAGYVFENKIRIGDQVENNIKTLKK